MSPAQGLTAGTAKAGPWARTSWCKDRAELLLDAARTAGRAVPRAGREAVQTFGIPE